MCCGSHPLPRHCAILIAAVNPIGVLDAKQATDRGYSFHRSMAGRANRTIREFGGSTMIDGYQHIEHTHSPICSSCGQIVRLLWDHHTVFYFLKHHSARRRAYQCKNCGQIYCAACSHNGQRCLCHSNAWVARPYLEDADATLQNDSVSVSNTRN